MKNNFLKTVCFILILPFLLTACGKKCDPITSASGASSSDDSCQAPTASKTVPSFFSLPSFAGSRGNLAVDSKGNIYYAAPNEYVIKKIDSAGTQSTFVGSGANAYTDGSVTGASFFSPQLVTMGPNDSIYVADGFKVRKVTQDGVVTTLTSMSGSGDFRGIAADLNGNVFVVWNDGTSSTHQILKVTPAGTVSVFAGATTAGYAEGNGTNAKFNNPYSLAVDSSNNLFVADTGNFLIRKVSPTAEVTTFAGSGYSGQSDGQGTAASFAFYNSYSSLATDAVNSVYVADMEGMNQFDGKKIRKITSSGLVSTYCGIGDVATTGTCGTVGIASRFGIAVAPDGSIYAADTSRIVRITP